MRLTSDEQRAICLAVGEIYGPTAVVRLFGSRVHDHLRGGDIDLHVEADDVGPDPFPTRSLRLRRLLDEALDEPKIDIVETLRGHDLSAIERIAYDTGLEIDMPPDGARRLLVDALDATRACLAALKRDLTRVQPLMPLTARSLGELDLETADLLTLFVKRFENLVEVSRRQLFRGVLVAAGEEHEHDSARKVRDRVGRLGFLAEPEDWARIEDTRNRTAHVYPMGDKRAADVLNEAFVMARRALELIGPIPDAVEARLRESGGRNL